jgi:hypothetical protein
VSESEPNVPTEFEPKVVLVRWPDDLDACTMANVFAVQAVPDGIILTIGQANPPIPFGTPEQQREQQRALTEVSADVVCRVILTPDRVLELANQLNEISGHIAKLASGGVMQQMAVAVAKAQAES